MGGAKEEGGRGSGDSGMLFVSAGMLAEPFRLSVIMVCNLLHDFRAECVTTKVLVSFPDPFRKNREGVWQHALHCRVQKEFNLLLNHVLMFTHVHEW